MKAFFILMNKKIAEKNFPNQTVENILLDFKAIQLY